MPPESRDLWARIEAFAIDGPDLPPLPFAGRLAREQGWDRAFAERAVREYKRFVFLAMTAGRPMCPSEQVDAVWHQHLTYTRSYWKRFCGETLGQPLHHEPTRGGGDEGEKHLRMYADTLTAYREAFGHEPPGDLWPPAERRFGEDARHVVVNAARNWIVPKVWAWRVAASAGVLTTVATGLGCGGLDPFALHGSEFLVFLVPVLLAAAAIGLVIRSVLSGPRAAHGEPPPDLTWGQTALLAGRNGRLLDAAVACLIRDGIVHVSSDEKRLQRDGLPSRDLNPVEQLVFASLPLDKTDRKALGKLRTELDGRAATDEERLQADGLVLSTARAKAVGRLAFLPFALVLFGLGGARLVMGLSSGRPVDYLVLAMVLALVGGGLLFGRRLRRTHKGDTVLKLLQEQRADLKTGHPDAGTADPAWAVALFGTSALVGLEYAALLRWYPKPTTGSGCGSGCSTTGGGCGGGGGSGCGGCGGGGGD